MKKFLTSRIFAFILGALIFGSIVGVSAYTIFADNIGYTPSDTTWKKSNGEDITNVEDAIDDLYTKANQPITLELYSDSAANGVAHLGIEFLKDKYKKFKVTNLVTSQVTSNCILASWAPIKGESVSLLLNQEYLVASNDDGFKFSYITAKSKTGTRCAYTILFYN